MKRILIVTEIFHPENGLVNDFALELVRRGYQVEVLTQHPSYPYGKIFDGYTNDYYSMQTWEGITIHRFKTVEGYRESKIRKILKYWTFVRIGKKIARKIGGNYDHVLVYQTGPLTLALPAVALKKKYGTPLTIWTFDIWPDAVYAYGFPKVFPLTSFLNHIIRKVYRNSDNILVSSRKFADVIGPYVPGRKIDYAPNWLISEAKEPATLQLSLDTFHFTFAGNISVSQNLGNVLSGWKRAELQNADLNIVGEGSALDRLKRQVLEQNIPNVRFHGRYPSCQIDDILRQSDVLVLPLISDPGIQKTEPFKLQSYLQAGKPIFGVLDGAAHEIIEENRLGLCASPDNPTDIAQKFAEIRKQVAQDTYRDIDQRAHRLLDTRFNKETTLAKIFCLIDPEQKTCKS